MAPWALPPSKNAINMAVARGIINMQSMGLASIDGAPSDDLESENCFSKKLLNLEIFFELVSALIDVATGHHKYAVNRVGEPLPKALCFPDFWRNRSKLFL